MLDILIGAGCLICAYRAVREKHLLISALWLALTSALVAWIIYRLGALEVAVVELSVGAGLVTVLFVFAINIAGDETTVKTALIPRPLAWGIIVIGVALLAWMIIPALQVDTFDSTMAFAAGSIDDFRRMVWQERSLDTLLQVVLIFSGVMAVLGLLGSRPEVETGLEEQQ
jgi:NADH:ubiquinone oxidoreductase subunit 6 (subunit J)